MNDLVAVLILTAVVFIVIASVGGGEWLSRRNE